MTNFEVAKNYTGLSAVALAERLGVSPQQLNGWLKGGRVPNRNNVEYIAKAMDVDAAWLLSVAQSVPVIDHATGTVYQCGIIHSESIADYGMFAVVWFAENGTWLPVILGDGVQFTPWDWEAPDNPRTASEIAEARWVDHRGQEAVMLDGLPRAMM